MDQGTEVLLKAHPAKGKLVTTLQLDRSTLHTQLHKHSCRYKDKGGHHGGNHWLGENSASPCFGFSKTHGATALECGFTVYKLNLNFKKLIKIKIF